ncbi:hypothetical protein [Metabacillus indicus]|uniref:hypothetical protein n=1 Tax=Metabacillus indicus TaxID=246786 RepID=UPI00049365FA|nr:hypothetical protein [Metabacillus indicus]KEZ52458.1 hypothetical protein AZ46_0201360 [Metabacillus indicus LMG 22858]
MHKDIESILDNWIEKINKDEFYLAHSFDKIIEKKSSAEAFEYIPHMIDAILETNDDFIASQLIFYLNCLYGKADTAEIHHAFISKKEEMEWHINNLDGEDSKREYLEFKRDLKIK